jgi:hypothetical protein
MQPLQHVIRKIELQVPCEAMAYVCCLPYQPLAAPASMTGLAVWWCLLHFSPQSPYVHMMG